MKSSRILGIGSYVPERIWTNDDLSQLMDTSDEWIQQRTGIKQRHWVDLDSETSSSDLGLKAAEQAIANAGIAKTEIDCILFATLSADHEFPGTACFFQAKLGLPGVPAIDVRQQCTGFIYATSIADNFIKTGMFKKILVVGAEVHSRGLQRTTEGRDVAVLFGDGAGAVVLGESDGESKILSTHLHADGSYAKELWVQYPGLANKGERYTGEKVPAQDYYPKMNGKAVFVNAVKRMPEVLMEALAKNALKLGDIDLFVFHQANLRINEMVAKQLGIPEDKVFNTIQRFGNTTAATIPIGLHEAVKAGKLKPGMTVASAAFGSGFTWASMIIKW
jgi:3-oxoacyl-[acyl-carrier-protein] synthase-3